MLLAIQDTRGLWGKTAETLDQIDLIIWHLQLFLVSLLFLNENGKVMKGRPRPSKQHKAREGEGQIMHEMLSLFYFKKRQNTRTFCARHGAGFKADSCCSVHIS